MTRILHRIPLAKTELIIAKGDLLDSGLDGIVSSEGTCFILSGNPNTISGQILNRCGEEVQYELYEQTQGDVLGAGIVLSTSGGDVARRIYHAGFHEPHSWKGLPGGLDDADYFESIGSCITQALRMATKDNIKTLGFPLIGCGIFGLSTNMLLRQFVEKLLEADRRPKSKLPAQVWLVIRDNKQKTEIEKELVKMAFEAANQHQQGRLPRTGLPLLDSFARKVERARDEEWRAWMLCRYSEVAIQVMLFGLLSGHYPSMGPADIFEKERSLTFGVVRDQLIKRAVREQTKERNDGWAGLFEKIAGAKTCAAQLGKINQERNHLAHGRKFAPPGTLMKWVAEGLRLDEWQNQTNSSGPARMEDWKPWITSCPIKAGSIGLFERWSSHKTRYLEPSSGHLFDLPSAGVNGT